VLSSFISQLENFASVMNFVIFPMFFASSALYPLWRVREASLTVYWISEINPFTHATELIRFALYGRVDSVSLGIVAVYTALFWIVAIRAYDPGRGLAVRRPVAE
jgi:ABC-2 type transport system permease protein